MYKKSTCPMVRIPKDMPSKGVIPFSAQRPKEPVESHEVAKDAEPAKPPLRKGESGIARSTPFPPAHLSPPPSPRPM